MKYLYKRCSCTGTCPHHYWYRFKFKGRLYRGSTHTTSRQLADRIAVKSRDVIVALHYGVAR
jgi:hypothetical protein